VIFLSSTEQGISIYLLDKSAKCHFLLIINNKNSSVFIYHLFFYSGKEQVGTLTTKLSWFPTDRNQRSAVDVTQVRPRVEGNTGYSSSYIESQHQYHGARLEVVDTSATSIMTWQCMDRGNTE